MGLKSPFYVSNSLINNLVQPRHLEVTRSEGDWFGYVEKIEAIRYLEHGKRLQMIETTVDAPGIDTQEDLDEAIANFKKMNS